MNIYMTWHVNSHGIGFTKNALAAFYGDRISIKDDWIDGRFEQKEMENSFLNENGFLFDEVHYFTVQPEVIKKEFTFRGNEKLLALEREDDANVLSIKEAWEDIFKKNLALSETFDYVEEKYSKNYDKIKEQLWRFIHYFPLEDQLEWFKTESNVARHYKDRFKEQRLSELKDLRDIKQLVDAVEARVQKLKEKYPDANYFVNVSMGLGEAMVVWYSLYEAGRLPKNTRFLGIWDDKSTTNKNKRFRDFYIKERPMNIVSSVKDQFNIFQQPTSKSRQLVNNLMKNYVEQGFAILLLGERGIGKSRLAALNSGETKFVAANCASFDDDNKAESELFGTTKGSFTGAMDKAGLFEDADGGILFLDEIHHLSKRVQAKLMRALSTDKDNYFHIRRLMMTKEKPIKCTIILASNLSVGALREALLPDFYDRISQLIIELPPLRETPQDRLDDWASTWKQLKFDAIIPRSFELDHWLKSLGLPGNYRDLQKIAIAYHTFSTFDQETRKMLPGSPKNALKFAKQQYLAYHSAQLPLHQIEFSSEQPAKSQVLAFKRRFAEWALGKFGSSVKAATHFRSLGEKISDKTLYNWMKGEN